MKDDKKFKAYGDKMNKPAASNDQLGENASEEWKNEDYDNASKGKSFTEDRPKP